MATPIKVGLAGFGNVGSGTYSILKRTHSLITQRAGAPITVKRVAVRNVDRVRKLVDEDVAVSSDWHDLVTDPEINVVVEAIGGIEPARSLILAAIDAGKHVVTANKALLAEHGNEIFKAAEEKGVNVALEAAVAGSIPIVKALREGLAANRVSSIAGIINGTCNFILSTMRDTGRSFDDVLAEAQRLGYAEADPTFDIEGIDSAHKLVLLSSIAFGVPVNMDKVHIEGISRLEAKDIKFAEELGYRVKLLGITKYTDYGIELRVHPALVPMRRLLANVEGAMNAVVVKGDAAESSLYYGKGAGSEPTGSAVVADLIDIARTADANVSERPKMPTTQHNPGAKDFADFGDTVCSYYLRIPVDDRPGVLADLARIIADNNISIESLIQREAPQKEDSTEVILMTHSTIESLMQRAIRTMQQLKSVRGPIVVLRKEELQ
jgi:Homoserine dehydrogenase